MKDRKRKVTFGVKNETIYVHSLLSFLFSFFILLFLLIFFLFSLAILFLFAFVCVFVFLKSTQEKKMYKQMEKKCISV
ncbi:hypothetical protein STCU_10792 [Strigomonas culicis]|uniref:Uncharacterized protein n=1 Tax=Strigomonas culicis TaxID=28005 RepID=S9TK00_9TRYP|nr:hypothetical protein STCU_10792 [Strigomonas culicis]|eukprot:EPY17139.1 hypothetical protein STCU_10792 [Strigomonas culicis]